MLSMAARTMPSSGGSARPRCPAGACSWLSVVTASGASRHLTPSCRSCRPSRSSVMPTMTVRPGSTRRSSPNGARTVQRQDLPLSSTRRLPPAAAGLAERRLAEVSPVGDIVPKPDMMCRLRQAETQRLAGDLSWHLNAAYLPTEPGVRIAGVYERAITTPTGKLAVIRRQDAFTLAPWRPVLETFRGRAVTGMIGPHRVTWTLDRGRGLPGRG